MLWIIVMFLISRLDLHYDGTHCNGTFPQILYSFYWPNFKMASQNTGLFILNTLCLAC